MSRYETQLQQFSISGEQVRQASDFVLVVEPSAPFSAEARKGRLYIVAEPAHESVREREACQAVMRVLRKGFYDDSSYSITSSLRKALNKANEILYQQNFSMPAHKRVFVGVTCAVLREQSLYIAQMQPAQAYVRAEAKLRSLPPNPSWAGGDPSYNEIKPNALGASLTIEPAFYQATLRPGDAVLVCASAFAPHLRRETVDYLLHLADPQAITDELLRFSSEYDLVQAHGLVLALSVAQPAEAPSDGKRQQRAKAEPSSIERWANNLSQRLQGRREREQTERKARRLSQTTREQRRLNELPEEPPPPPRQDLRVNQIELGESLEQRVGQVRNERMQRLGSLPARPEEHDLTPSSFLGEGDYIVPQEERSLDLGDKIPRETFTSYARRSHGKVPDIEPTLGERVAEPFTRAAASVRIAAANRSRRRQLPPSALPPKRRNAGLTYRKEGPRFPWMQLALLLLIVVLLVVVGYNQLENNNRQEQVEVLADARQKVGALRTAPDEATALKLLSDANIALDTVRGSGVISDSAALRQEFLGLEREYERVQASVQRVSYLDDLTEIGAHPQAGAGSTFSTLVVPPPPTTITDTAAFESIYALDSSVGAIYRMPKGGGEMTPFLQTDQTLPNGVQVGRIKAMAWRLDNVVAVGQIQNGYVYYFRTGSQAGDWSNSNLGSSSDWRQDIAKLRFVTYQGNLYFWGPLPSQVLKYKSGEQSNTFAPWITNFGDSNIESALDLAIDGSVYLLRPNGSVQVFDQQSFLKEIPAPQIDPPISAVTDFVVTGESPQSGSIFLLEQSLNRIVQIDKTTGAFIQQLRVRPGNLIQLNGLTTLTVDSSGPQQALYLVNNGRILRAVVPAPPKPFEPGQAQTTPEATATP